MECKKKQWLFAGRKRDMQRRDSHGGTEGTKNTEKEKGKALLVFLLEGTLQDPSVISASP